MADSTAIVIYDNKKNHNYPTPIPHVETIIQRIFWLTLLPIISHRYKVLRIIIPILINLILGAASFCLLYYPAYYPTQGEIWTMDIALAWFTYNYMIYLFTQWDAANCFEEADVTKPINRITLTFYWLYLFYWLYFAIIQFSNHNDPDTLIQFGNILMSTAWFIFFSTMAALYYFICIRLAQRSITIRKWLKDVKHNPPNINDFYVQYNDHWKAIRKIGKYWNILIFVGSLILTFHIPIDLISIIYNRYYYDIAGLVIKILSLLWYVWRICELNDNETYLISYIYKHRIYGFSELNDIKKYVEYRSLGLDFYGIKINKSFLIKISLIILNFVIPTIYALFSNKILK